MDCNQYQRMLELKLDSELDQADQSQLDTHLSACLQCRQYAAAQTRLWQELDQGLTLTPPQSLLPGIMNEVKRYQQRALVQRLFLGLAAVLVSGALMGFGLLWLIRALLVADYSLLLNSWAWSLAATTGSVLGSLVRAWALVLSSVPPGYWIGVGLIILVSQLTLFRILNLPVVKVRKI